MLIQIGDTLFVGASPEAVIIRSTAASNADGETHPSAVFLLLPAADAIEFANAVLRATANLPEEDFSDVPAEFLGSDSK